MFVVEELEMMKGVSLSISTTLPDASTTYTYVHPHAGPGAVAIELFYLTAFKAFMIEHVRTFSYIPTQVELPRF